MTRPPTIVLLGLMTKIPVAGVVWQTLHYLLGLRRLGLEPYYVEAHASTPSMLMARDDDDGAALAAAYIDRIMRRFDLGGRWAYHALHDDGRCYGMTQRELLRLYDRADAIVNLHGGTVPRPEHSRGGRLVYLETDPVQLQAELQDGVAETVDFLEEHCAFFTFAENWGAPDCGLPRSDRFPFRPTRQPVCLDLWPALDATPTARFTTVANWRQPWRDVTVAGRTYSWSKHQQFERCVSLPGRVRADFELALSNCEGEDRRRLAAHGWRVRDATPLSTDIDRYRDYIRGSRGEFTVAKEQNVALRSGWFSDRSATYLAAGRPVITQDTGFSNVLPTGAGLHAFATLDEAADAIETVGSDYEGARRSAHEIAREWFASDVVLADLLRGIGVPVRGSRARAGVLTGDLRLTPVSRRPLRLDAATVQRAARAPLPPAVPGAAPTGVDASVVVVSHDDVVLTRLCVESVLANTRLPFELIVVDNGSRDGSRVYLRSLERRRPEVRVLLNDANRGFPAACNQGLQTARGRVCVILNNDVVVPPGGLERLVAVATDPEVGLAGPTTNRIGNEAEVQTGYETYAGFLAEARERSRRHDGQRFEIPMPAMFCLALRRDVYAALGPLDEGFGLGTLEDDDYAMRARRHGWRLVCAEDVLVHHFGEGAFGRLFASGAHSELLSANRRRFEEKWSTPWQPYSRRHAGGYEDVCRRVGDVVLERVPPHATVVVVSRGDERLVRFAERQGWHFPQMPDGVYAGHYPADSGEAIRQLEDLRSRGAGYFLLPGTSRWWLEHYRGLAVHLSERYRELVREQSCVVFDLTQTR